MEDSTKWWLDSTTVQGALMTYVPSVMVVLNILHIQVGNGEVNALVSGIAGIMGLVGACMAIYGRFKAKTLITMNKDEVTQ